uniref:Reverse transcriptase domain-containing protein n=1 Tax=Haemonchus contortus TaxID=6289 RepID=A0A7I4YVJ8_HAECO
MGEAAKAGKNIRNTRQSFANYKTKMTDGTATAYRRAMEMVIYDFYSDLFDSHVYLSTFQFRQDGYVIPSNLPSEIRHSIASTNECTGSGLDRIKPEHSRSFHHLLSDCLGSFERFVRSICDASRKTCGRPSYSELFITIQLVFVRFSNLAIRANWDWSDTTSTFVARYGIG